MHNHHILEAGVRIWGEKGTSTPGKELGTLFRRMYEPKGVNISGAEVFKYWEAMIAGAPLYPQGVKLMVGSFPLLFGAEIGRALQKWCIRQGWVLVWAFGNPLSPQDDNSLTKTWLSNRTLDPLVFAHTTASHNLSITPHATTAFEAAWAEANATLSAMGSAGDNNPYMSAALNLSVALEVWGQLSHGELDLDFLSGRSCGNVNGCVGVHAGSGTCVCYHGPNSRIGANQLASREVAE
jgi:hypothetical protein